jgi:hypothetical protein
MTITTTYEDMVWAASRALDEVTASRYADLSPGMALEGTLQDHIFDALELLSAREAAIDKARRLLTELAVNVEAMEAYRAAKTS